MYNKPYLKEKSFLTLEGGLKILQVLVIGFKTIFSGKKVVPPFFIPHVTKIHPGNIGFQKNVQSVTVYCNTPVVDIECKRGHFKLMPVC